MSQAESDFREVQKNSQASEQTASKGALDRMADELFSKSDSTASKNGMQSKCYSNPSASGSDLGKEGTGKNGANKEQTDEDSAGETKSWKKGEKDTNKCGPHRENTDEDNENDHGNDHENDHENENGTDSDHNGKFDIDELDNDKDRWRQKYGNDRKDFSPEAENGDGVEGGSIEKNRKGKEDIEGKGDKSGRGEKGPKGDNSNKGGKQHWPNKFSPKDAALPQFLDLSSPYQHLSV